MKFLKIVVAETEKPANETIREGIATGIRGVADAVEHPTHVITKPKQGLANAISWLADKVEPARNEKAADEDKS